MRTIDRNVVVGGDFADQLVLARATQHAVLPVITRDQRFGSNTSVIGLGPEQR